MLYKQIKEKEEILNKLLFENDGEITPEFELIENSLNDDRETLIEYLCKQTKNDEVLAGGLKNEEERLNKQRKSLDNKINKRKEFIKFLDNGEKGQYGSFKIGYRYTPLNKLIIEDENLLPKKYFKISKSVNKQAIKEVLKTNKKVKGAFLQDTNTLTIK